MSTLKLSESRRSVNPTRAGGIEDGKGALFMIKLDKELWHRKISREGVGAGMRQTLRKHGGWVRLGMAIAFVLAMVVPSALFADAQVTTVHVQVNDAQTGKPIYQARLTLRFREQGGFMRHSKIISYTSKTDKDGKGLFPVVPMGTVTLMVTAPDHNTFGKEFQITKQNQLIEVKLQKPHPVL